MLGSSGLGCGAAISNFFLLIRTGFLARKPGLLAMLGLEALCRLGFSNAGPAPPLTLNMGLELRFGVVERWLPF